MRLCMSTFNTLPRVETAETNQSDIVWRGDCYTFNTLPRVETAETSDPVGATTQ